MYKLNQHSIREQCAEIFLLLHHANQTTAAKRLFDWHSSPTLLPNNAMHSALPILKPESTQIVVAAPTLSEEYTLLCKKAWWRRRLRGRQPETTEKKRKASAFYSIAPLYSAKVHWFFPRCAEISTFSLNLNRKEAQPSTSLKFLLVNNNIVKTLWDRLRKRFPRVVSGLGICVRRALRVRSKGGRGGKFRRLFSR